MAFGAPDWLASRWPVRSTMGTNQARFIITGAGSVVAGATLTLSFDVSSSFNLVLSAITAASPVSCINYLLIQINDVTFYHKYWDMNGDLFFPTDAGPIVPGGANLKITIQNNDAAAQTMRISLAGTYEER